MKTKTINYYDDVEENLLFHHRNRESLFSAMKIQCSSDLESDVYLVTEYDDFSVEVLHAETYARTGSIDTSSLVSPEIKKACIEHFKKGGLSYNLPAK